MGYISDDFPGICDQEDYDHDVGQLMDSLDEDAKLKLQFLLILHQDKGYNLNSFLS